MNRYSCTFCKKNFLSQDALHQHQEIVHDMFSPSVVRETNEVNLEGHYTLTNEDFDKLVTPQQPQQPKQQTPIRKDMPLFSGCLQYFPDALLAVANHSLKGNRKHNPGQPLHWDRTKSSDQADCVARHLLDIGPNWNNIDEETGSYHATALAWRALALLQTVIEKEKK